VNVHLIGSEIKSSGIDMETRSEVHLTLVLMDTYTTYPMDIDRSINEDVTDKIRK
jgi:hypothetical protein